MDKIYFIAKKELATYFKSPIAYIILAVTISIFNIFFFMIIEQNQEASLREFFQLTEFMFLFLVPLMTMRVFSEEKLTGTMEFLMTAPVTNTAIVLGKYIGVLSFFTVLISMMLVYFVIINYFGQPDRIETLVGYFGIWLEGAFFLAIGVMASSWTRNQIVAAMITYLILFLLYFSPQFSQYFEGPITMIFQQMSTVKHLENLTSGIITITDITYYISGIFICIVFTRLSIENRLA
ncbi:MAG: ABC transporter permease subunit [Pseudomonadales bacterium]|nr:ABC transporter permease subunit [Pseudomonadales bacterium]